MTRATNARVAGATLLLYIAVGIGQMLVGRGVSSGNGIRERLASIAQHAHEVHVNVILSLVTGFIALTLAVALYGITHDEDRELSLLALACRVAEGLLGAFSALASLALLWLATEQAGAPDDRGAFALAGVLMRLKAWIPIIAATFFAVGSMVFAVLLVRGRMVPIALAWLGVVASAILVVLLPLQLVGLLPGALGQLMWLPMAAFEVPLGVWLLVKGVAEAPQARV